MAWRSFGFGSGSSIPGNTGIESGGGASTADHVSLTPIPGFVDGSNNAVANLQVAAQTLYTNESNTEADLEAHLTEAENAHDGAAIFYDGTNTRFMVPGTDVNDPGFQKNVKFALDSLDAALGNVEDNFNAHLSDLENAHDGGAIYFDGTLTNFMVPGSNPNDSNYQKNVTFGLLSLDDALANVRNNLNDHLLEPENAHDGSSIFFDGTGTHYMVPGSSPTDPGFQKNVTFALKQLDAAIYAASPVNNGVFRDREPLTLIHDSGTGEDYFLTQYEIMPNCQPFLDVGGLLQSSGYTVMINPGDNLRRKVSLGVGSGIQQNDPVAIWYRSVN